MGSNTNLKYLGNSPASEGEGGGSGRPASGNFSFPLARQSSVYSLTFDEFGNSLGKEFGSMNMDELLKSIWTSEETQNTPPMPPSSGPLQRQGSLALPRTLSQKTVSEVWRDMSKEFGGAVPQETQRQPTLGEITLEEFLSRAGLVREDLFVQPNNNANNEGFGIDFQQPSQCSSHGVGVIATNQLADNKQPPIFPKQSAVSYAPTMSMLSSAQMGSSAASRGGAVGNLGQGFGLQAAAAVSPATLLSDGQAKRNGDRPSVSPLPYVFNGGIRGRKTNSTVEKVIERRQKRMIKNRESAARSRARKQAYTTDLEEELAKLKEENEQLRLKEAKIVEMHKNQILEIMLSKCGSKRRSLRRTQTGLW